MKRERGVSVVKADMVSFWILVGGRRNTRGGCQSCVLPILVFPRRRSRGRLKLPVYIFQVEVYHVFHAVRNPTSPRNIHRLRSARPDTVFDQTDPHNVQRPSQNPLYPTSFPTPLFPHRRPLAPRPLNQQLHIPIQDPHPPRPTPSHRPRPSPPRCPVPRPLPSTAPPTTQLPEARDAHHA